MIRAYKLEYKGGEKPPVYYTTLAALAADNRDVLDITPSKLYKIDFDQGAYEGKRCRVSRIEILNSVDVVSRL